MDRRRELALAVVRDMEGLDVRSRRSSRNVEPGSLTPRLSARGDTDEEGRSLAQLAAGVAGLSSQADRVAQQRGDDTRSTLKSMEEMSKSLAAAMDSRKVSVAEARRRAGVAQGGGPRPDPVSAADLDDAARAMVEDWLEPRGLAQYAERIVFAFKEAAYRPHEWTHTLDSMGPNELREFIAAVEKSPAPKGARPSSPRGARAPSPRGQRPSTAPAKGGGGASPAAKKPPRKSTGAETKSEN